MKQQLLTAIENVKKKIPEQGPLEYFVHHNTLHHYEHLNFFDAVKKAAHEYGSRAFMTEEFYLNKYQTGVLKHADLFNQAHAFILSNHLELKSETLLDLLLDQTPVDATKYTDRIHQLQKQYVSTRPMFFSEILKEKDGLDLDYYTFPTIYRFMSAYFDYGVAHWPMEDRQEGMWPCFYNLHAKSNWLEGRYSQSLAKVLKALVGLDSLSILGEILDSLQIEEPHTEDYLFSLCIKHKGWAGFIKSLIGHPEYIKDREVVPNFNDYMAILLVCEYAALKAHAKVPMSVPEYKSIPLHSKSFLARYLRHAAQDKELVNVLPHLTDFNRQEVFHKGYESSFYQMVLSAYQGNHPIPQTAPYDYQVILCMDDREESFRRYLETNPKCETFGVAGHFGLNIQYKGYFDKSFRALCPVNVNPEFQITETAVTVHRFRTLFLRSWAELKWFVAKGSRTFLGGVLETFIMPIFKMIPDVLDVLNPNINYTLKKRFRSYLNGAVVTKLNYRQEDCQSHGIPFTARVAFAENLLRMIGIKEFSSRVFIIGHGSSSLNNPHRAAYDCGACGGGIGSNNARLIAAILNEAEIRDALKERGFLIPEETLFIGGYHNTCSDEVDFFDEKDESFIAQIREAAKLSARERCRRFKDIPAGKNPEYYLHCVQGRSMDIRQPRPEYGHSTNAIFYVGPRMKTRDLFMDRRAFLLSYEPELDHQGQVLKQLLNAAVPVVAGINLEYYFSFIDNEFYGCGTKLPHNVNGLVGVINGHLSDLRPGLPWQMVEIHQPVRLLLIIDCKLEMAKNLLIDGNSFRELIENEWINLVVHDSETNKLWMYSQGVFVEFSQIESPYQYLENDMLILHEKHHLRFGRIGHG